MSQDTEPTADLLLPQMFELNAGRWPERIALSDEVRQVSWRELADESGRLAAGLAAMGLSPGDRVAVLAANSARYVEAVAGIWRAGGVLTPLSGLFDDRALAEVLRDAQAKLVLACGASAARIDGLRAAYPDLPVQQWVLIEGAPRPGWTRLDDFPPETFPWKSAAPPASQPATIVYSSGTTGTPKGIVHSHRLRALGARNFAGLSASGSLKTVLSTPLCSNWTLTGLFQSLWNGGHTIILRKFEADSYLAMCAAEQPDLAFLVPQQIERLLDHPGFGAFELGDKTWKFCAGSPLAAVRKAELVARWPGGVIEIYGMTEGGVTTSLEAHLHPDKLDSVGRPATGVEVRIIDEQGRELPPGAIGEIVGRSPYVMDGYHNREELTRALAWRCPEGREFQRTGDIGRVDQDGFIYLMDRSKDLIISGGQNVYPSDIEQVLSGHPAVAEVAVIGAPSTRWGETPVAVVVTRDGMEADAEGIRQWANGRLGKHQQLAAVDFIGELPRGSLDKVLKKELRDRYGAARD